MTDSSGQASGPISSPAALPANKESNPSRNSIMWGPVIISILVFLLAFLLSFYLPERIRTREGAKWIKPLEMEMTNRPPVMSVTGSEDQKARLEEQVGSLVKRADHHFQIMMYFYSNYYVDLLLCAIFSGWAMLSLVLVSRVGWEKANPALLSFFLSTTVCGAFFFGFSKMCKQEENVAENKVLYLTYISLLNDARTYVATRDYVGRSKSEGAACCSEPLANFILHLDEEMKKANNIMISFDSSKLPDYKFSTESK